MLKFLKCISLLLLPLLPLACISHKQTCALTESPSSDLHDDMKTLACAEPSLINPGIEISCCPTPTRQAQTKEELNLVDSPVETAVEEQPFSISELETQVVEEAIESVDFDLLSEALGHFLVRNLKNPSFDFKLEKIILGMQNESEGIPSPLSEEEYERKIALVQEQIFLQNAERNLNEANSFLEKNGLEEGVEILEDKLQYRIDAQGQGEEVSLDSIPLIHYTGKLIDGTTFVNSHETGEPIALPLKQTIPGFSKGLVGMKEGEKRTIYIHPELAFGLSGYLPPNSLLIFEVEVLKVNNGDASEVAAELSENPEIMDTSFE